MKIVNKLVRNTALAAGMLWSAVAPVGAVSVGDTAPDVRAQSALNGKVTEFNLQGALAKHAVVLYFFVKAFNSG